MGAAPNLAHITAASGEEAKNLTWRVEIRHDVVRAHWDEAHRSYVYYEYYHVFAFGPGVAYLHFYHFWDDWGKAQRLVDRIHACPNWTPEGKPNIWKRVVDTAPIRPYKREWWKMVVFSRR